MPTISELMTRFSKVPGDLRVYASSWGSWHWFRPYYRAGAAWYGLDQDGNSNTCGDGQYNWQFLEEPRPKDKVKVKKWLWAYEIGITGPTWYITNAHLTEQEAQAQLGAWPLAKIEQSMREYPAEDKAPEPAKKGQN